MEPPGFRGKPTTRYPMLPTLYLATSGPANYRISLYPPPRDLPLSTATSRTYLSGYLSFVVCRLPRYPGATGLLWREIDGRR